MPPIDDKYEADDPAFDTAHGVLRNRLGITDPAELERVETRANENGFRSLILAYSETHRFGEQDVREIHRALFGEVFSWAGEYRRVDISSAEIRWCHARFIENEMARYGTLLTELTPLTPDLPHGEVVRRLARIHGELIVIHPFRDGNGRTSRVLQNLLLLQAEHDPIDSPDFHAEEIRPIYHRAIREVWARMDYGRLETLLTYLIAPKR